MLAAQMGDDGSKVCVWCVWCVWCLCEITTCVCLVRVVPVCENYLCVW